MTPFDRLKILCDKQGISINVLEERVGLGQNTLYSWKKKIPSGQNLTKVADYFNVSIDYLLGRTDNPTIKDDDDFLVAAHIDGDFTEEEMEDIRDYIEFIKSKHRR
ncbi:helix-turn-helix domain-containing protein [Facklamia sp. P12950]|uniref:helix-turn-helix domain-containing protein n=1 Tax=Facklamia sp. P12950 TaxID=3421951 RepID=UPI003D185CBE